MGGALPASLLSKYYQCALGLVKVQNVKSEWHFALTQRKIQIVHKAIVDNMPVLKITINSVTNICFIAVLRNNNNEKHYFNDDHLSNLVNSVLKCGQYFVLLVYPGLSNDSHF